MVALKLVPSWTPSRRPGQGRHDDLMRVPGKPLGFLAASTIEYHPARPEAHRSTVLAGQKLHSSRPPKPRELDPVRKAHQSLRHK